MAGISVIIPTLNAGATLDGLLAAVRAQSLPSEIVVIDSASSDDTLEIARRYEAKIIPIKRRDFRHGSARSVAGKAAAGDILVYLTQDALPMDTQAIEQLIVPLQTDDQIGATYGRQVAAPGASPFATHLRAFNYPAHSCVKSLEDCARLGMRTAFISNAFSAYRRSVLSAMGWFKEGLMMGEDVQMGARLLLAHYRIAYVAKAQVYHAHNYTLAQEFRRYAQIGAFHRQEDWMLREFGKSEGEGLRYAQSELRYLARHRQHYLMPLSLLRNGLKYAGYSWGRWGGEQVRAQKT